MIWSPDRNIGIEKVNVASRDVNITVKKKSFDLTCSCIGIVN